MTKEEFINKYCHNCSSQRCEGIGTAWFDRCHFKNELYKTDISTSTIINNTDLDWDGYTKPDANYTYDSETATLTEDENSIEQHPMCTIRDVLKYNEKIIIDCIRLAIDIAKDAGSVNDCGGVCEPPDSILGIVNIQNTMLCDLHGTLVHIKEIL